MSFISGISAERISEMRKPYEKKLDEFELNYQDTGSPSTQKTIYKYRELLEIFSLAEMHLKGECRSCERHEANVKSLIEKYEAYQKSGLKDFEDFGHFISDLKSIRY